MDGKTLLRMVREDLSEPSGGFFLDDYLTFDYLHEAAIEFVLATEALTGEDSITTIADQANYTLAADFLGLYMRNRLERYFVKLNDGTNNYFINHREFEDIYYADQGGDSTPIPNHFTLRDKQSIDSDVTGTSTSTSTATGLKSSLIDSAGDFSTVEPADRVYNTTQATEGVVVAVTSSTQVETALFDPEASGGNVYWTSADAYTIQPQGKMELYFDPPPSVAAYTVTVPYLKRPAPVYTYYDSYRFQQHWIPYLIEYAKARYKLRDEKLNFAAGFLTQWRGSLIEMASATRKTKVRKKIKVNMRARQRS